MQSTSRKQNSSEDLFDKVLDIHHDSSDDDDSVKTTDDSNALPIQDFDVVSRLPIDEHINRSARSSRSGRSSSSSTRKSRRHSSRRSSSSRSYRADIITKESKKNDEVMTPQREENAKRNKARLSKESSSRRINTVGAVYGNDADTKAIKKNAKDSCEITSIVYGSDASDAKTKRKVKASNESSSRNGNDEDEEASKAESVHHHSKRHRKSRRKSRRGKTKRDRTRISTSPMRGVIAEAEPLHAGDNKYRRALVVGFCMFILAVGGGIAAWMLVRSSNNSSEGTVPGDGKNGVESNVSDAPTDHPIAITNTSSSPSGFPSSNPQITFEPLSPEDCNAIATGYPIEGQETMPIQTYRLDLDVIPGLSSMDLVTSAGIINVTLNNLLTPELTGCNRENRNLRHLEDGYSYVIGNVMVDSFGVEGVSCEDNSNSMCHRVLVNLDIVVKDETVKNVSVIAELSIFLKGLDLVKKLDLTGLYVSIKVANLQSTDPSINDPSPSSEPSKTPSSVSFPTVEESPILSDKPTRAPTSAPPTSAPVSGETPSPTTLSTTSGPTQQPGQQATPSPSTGPINQPTLSPTPPPTASPTPLPSVSDPTPPPSTSPTQVASTRPTNAPVVPSESPSTNPSPPPSSRPTATPSSSPSPAPTPTPSSQPTKQPSTAAPTPIPTSAPTDQPSAAPSSAAPVPISLSADRCGYLESVLGNRASLHQLAIDWMCNTDTWEPTEEESYPEQWHDRYAVVAFIYARNDDDPDTFDYWSLSDLSTQSICTLVSCCDSCSGSKVLVLNGQMSIGAHSQTFGYLPTAIGLLTSLTALVHVHEANGIPTEIGVLTALTEFSIRNGGGSGMPKYDGPGVKIPTEISALTRLQTFHGGQGEGITGTIPSELLGLTTLTYLYLASNQLTGNIPPSMGGLTKLKSLILSANQLNGAIPPSIGNLKSLEELSLDRNEFTGSVPPSIFELTNLVWLNLATLQLTGSISAIGDLKNLRWLFLNGNQLSGDVGSIGALTLLSSLYLSGNRMNGSLPTSIGAFTNLTTFVMSSAGLTGIIPPSIGGLKNLEWLFLDGNQLSGSIPSSIAELTVLTRLDIDSNRLTGPVPELPPSLRVCNLVCYFCDAPTNIFDSLPSSAPSSCRIHAL